MLVAGHSLNDRNHEAEIEWVGDSCDRDLNFSVAEPHDREVHILNDSRSSSIHLLHKFPYPLVDYKIVLFFSDVVSELVFGVEQPRIVDASQLS